MPRKCFAQKPFRCGKVSPLAQPELDRVTIAVDGALEIPPLPANLDVSFVDVPLGSDGSLACIEAVKKLRRVADNPPVNGRVIDGDSALGHHLLKISQAQIVSQVPPDAEQDHGSIKMPALEHATLRYRDRKHGS